MTLTACPHCGTQTGAGFACVGCGTPVPSDAAAAATSAPSQPEAASGHAAYWHGMLPRVQQLLAPKYRVAGLLGYGGMAGVFAAEEPRLGRRVAIKVMSPALMMDPQLVERFVQEARTIALLDHSNIVDIYEVDAREDLHWFVMSYLPGRTLGQVMTDALEPLAVDVVRAWLYQVGDALAYAHHHGIVHRDIKPGNVLLDQRGNAHVTDFGIAKATDGEAGLTRTGMLVGTPAYMSPEQCSGGDVGGASDQYSLGAVVYQMLTGFAPFEGATLSVLQAHVTEPPRRLEELREDCPVELADAVHRMLEKRPEDRWPSLGAAVAAAGAAPLGLDDPLRPTLELLAAHATHVEILGAAESVLEGSRTPLRVIARDSQGRELEERRVRWASNNASVAAVDDDVLSAYSPGAVQLEAASGEARAWLAVNVVPDPVRELAVTPTELSLPRGGVGRVDAAAYDLDGSRLDDRALLWSTSDPAIVRVSPDGVVQGVASGQAVVVARTGSRFATASITVTAEQAAAAARPDQRTTGGHAARTTAGRRQRTTASRKPAAAGTAGRQAAPAAPRLSSAGPRRLAVIGVGVAVVLLAAAMLGRTLLVPTPAPLPEPAGEVVNTPAPPPTDPPAVPAPVVQTSPEPVTEPQPGPAQPTPATLRIGVDLPASAVAIARARDGREYTLGRAPVALPAGSYALEVNAPGYEPQSSTLDLAAGVGRSWSPVLRPVVAQAPPPVPPPAPQPREEPPAPAPAPAPARDLAADRAAVQAEVTRFVEAMSRRDGAVVLPLMAGSMRTQWQTLFANTSSFSATLGGMQPVELQDDGATVRFTVNIAFRNPNGAGTAAPTFTATAQRSGNSWRITGISN